MGGHHFGTLSWLVYGGGPYENTGCNWYQCSREIQVVFFFREIILNFILQKLAYMHKCEFKN